MKLPPVVAFVRGYVSAGYYPLEPGSFSSISESPFMLEYDLYPALDKTSRLEAHIRTASMKILALRGAWSAPAVPNLWHEQQER